MQTARSLQSPPSLSSTTCFRSCLNGGETLRRRQHRLPTPGSPRELSVATTSPTTHFSNCSGTIVQIARPVRSAVGRRSSTTCSINRSSERSRSLGGDNIADFTFLQLLWDDSPNCTTCPFGGGPAKFNNMFYQPQFGAL